MTDNAAFFYILVDANPKHAATNALVWELLEHLHNQGGLILNQSRTGKLNLKRACLAANFLATVQHMQKKRKENFIFRANRNHWHNRSKIGTQIVLNFRKALINSNMIVKVRSHFNDGAGRGFASKAELFEISEHIWGKVGVAELSFRTCEYLNPVKATVHKNNDTETIVANESSSVYQDFVKLRDWHENMPLVTPEGAEIGYGSRDFNHENFDVGGRYQCAYSNVPAVDRANYTLNGEPIVEVDISACNPTILTAMTGRVHSSWLGRDITDPYETLVTEDFTREEIKNVIVRLIGAGNAKKQAGFPDYQLGLATATSRDKKGKPTKFRANQKYKDLLQHLREMLPCLNDLKRKILDSNTLSFHESEIMTRVAEGRMYMGHPTYILHDGILVPESHAAGVAEHLQVAFEGYCDSMGWPLIIKPSVTQERAKVKLADRLPMTITDRR
ncbi:hypothetical protein [Primorskyibacter flagellatus]|uniref:hypothetical protein n=1 Tax=Primorskyibacter flagellatus TaxID=1387277 RepID=UPI003A8D5F73